ncbi:zinc finger protein DPF3 isoform X3 [Erinaceus europaeus]|uniref:Zinc finger protein DPF3 isoform X3 n=1 Tax=Erinaceus europaeus TaxID=9365 RepID=A0ABM3W4K5_ERIEU|nr:zinc finger protein DPF3 isoform X3 [Erinaceus europaeus]
MGFCCCCCWVWLGDQFYKEAIEHCRSYNSRLCAERSVRLPFLDSQTGVAQNNCYIWMEKRHRGPGLAPGQLYTYPARCWRKKRRLHPPEDPKLRLLEIKPEVELPLKKDGLTSESTTLEALLRGGGVEKKVDAREEESIQEIQRVLENEENVEEGNEEEDLEEDIPKRKNRTRGRARGSTGGRRRQDAASQEDHDKPYVCDTALPPLVTLCCLGGTARAWCCLSGSVCCRLPGSLHRRGLPFPPLAGRGPLWIALLSSGSPRKLCGSSVINRLYFYLVPFRHVILWDRNDLWRGHKAHSATPKQSRGGF